MDMNIPDELAAHEHLRGPDVGIAGLLRQRGRRRYFLAAPRIRRDLQRAADTLNVDRPLAFSR